MGIDILGGWSIERQNELCLLTQKEEISNLWVHTCCTGVSGAFWSLLGCSTPRCRKSNSSNILAFLSLTLSRVMKLIDNC